MKGGEDVLLVAPLQVLVQQIVERVGRLLERRGLVERDMKNGWFTTDRPGGPLDDLIGHSITYRIALGSPPFSQSSSVAIRSPVRWR